MRGVIIETKNRRAVILTKSGEFVNIKNKSYQVGDSVNIVSSTGRLCAMAACFFIVCAGIGSYFVPTGYVSVDINPSLMMTLNIYNRVIDVTSFNDDARVLLDKTDIRGKSAEKSVEMLIEMSEEIGYINDDNRDVILEVVPGIIKPNMDAIKHKNIEITNEIADRETLYAAQNIGVSIAKVKAIEEYTEKNGGDMRSNATKFNDKSVKEIRNIMADDGRLSDKNPPAAQKPQERGNESILDLPKPPEKSKPQDNTNDNSLSVNEPKQKNKILPSDGQIPKNEYSSIENISHQGEDKPQEIPPTFNEKLRQDIQSALTPPENAFADDNDNLQSKLPQEGKPAYEKPPAHKDPIFAEQSQNDNIDDQEGGELVIDKPSFEDNKPIDTTPQTHEQKPNIPKQDSDSLQNNPQSEKPKQENDTPPAENPKSQETTVPMEERSEPHPNKQPPSEEKREDISGQSKQPPQMEAKPQNDGENSITNEDTGRHAEKREMP